MSYGAIFLDVDGVLNSEAFMLKLDEQHRQLGHTDANRHEHTCVCYKLNHQIDRDAVTRLNRLVAETSAKIVISSSWRKLLDPPELHRVLTDHGLVAEIIGETPDGPNDPEMLEVFGHMDRIFRGHEIDLWLRKHPEVDRFVILDDGSDMEMHSKRLVQTDCAEGLLDEHVDLAIRMMSWDGKTIPSPNGRDGSPMSEGSCGSSAGLHCHQDGCVEALVLTRTTTVQTTHEDDYQRLMVARDAAAVLLGWLVYRGVLWCPTHVAAKMFAEADKKGDSDAE